MRASTYIVGELEVSAPGIHRLNGDLHCGCSLLLFARKRQTKKCLQQLHEENRKGDPLGARDNQLTLTYALCACCCCACSIQPIEILEPDPESSDFHVPCMACTCPQRPLHALLYVLQHCRSIEHRSRSERQALVGGLKAH